MKLNLGCGKNELEGFKNVDYPMIDLNQIPFKIEGDKIGSNSIDYIECSNVVEHLNITLEKFLMECHRILKYKGRMHLKTNNFFRYDDRINFLLGNWHKMNSYHRRHLTMRTYTDFLKTCHKMGFDVMSEDYGVDNIIIKVLAKVCPSLFARRINLVLWKQSEL